jgi:hypothetical protein
MVYQKGQKLFSRKGRQEDLKPRQVFGFKPKKTLI